MMLLLGTLLILAGGVWLAQGLDLPFAPGSFMTAEPAWAVIGGATLAAGLVVLARELLSRRRHDG